MASYKGIIRTFIALIVFLFIIFIFSRGRVYEKSDLEYGVTFSIKQARSFGLDWQAVYESALNELGVRNLRLSAYWDEIEKANNNFYWDELDWQIQKAEEAGAEIILAVGGRLPRWPECHFPDWTNGLSEKEREKEILEYIEKVISRYKKSQAIILWQIENEPFLSHFGDCPEFDSKFLDQETALARSLDSRKIVITDSGELSLWVFAAKRADIFGTSIYLNTYSSKLQRYIRYPISPGFFRFKKNIVNFFAHPKEWIAIEVQAEPWGKKSIKDLSEEEKSITMDKNKFRDVLEFSRLAGFRKFYLWGVEWWYWERERDNPVMWEEAKNIFK